MKFKFQKHVTLEESQGQEEVTKLGGLRRPWTIFRGRATEILNWLRKMLVIRVITLPPSTIHLINRTLFIAACFLFAAGIVLWTRRNILKFEEETVTKVNRYMFGITREKAQYIEQFIQEIQDYLGLLARKPFSGEFKKGQPLPYNDYAAGEALLEHVGGRVDSIYRMDKKGVVLHRIPHRNGIIGKDFSKAPGIGYVLKNHKPYVSEIFALSPGAIGFYICNPVFDEANFLGLLSILINVDTFGRSICHIQAGSTGAIWVIDDKGLILSHSNPDFIGKNILKAEEDTFADFDWSEFEHIVRRMTDGEEGHGVYHSMRRTDKTTEIVKKAVVFLPIKLGDQMWSIAMTTDYEEIAAPVKRNTRNNFLGAALMMVIVGAVGVIYSRSQKRKTELEAIARSAEELRISHDKLKFEIEQRNQAEKAREESESNYRLLAENVLDIIWIADLNFRLTYISPSVTRVLGLTPQEAIGQTMQELLSPPSLEMAMKTLVEEFAKGQEQKEKSWARTVDSEICRKDGVTIWAETKVSFLYDSKGTLAGLMGVTRDITEKFQLQQQLLQAQKMESIGTLAGGIAHDFNNLLGGILGYASLMKAKLRKDHQVFSYADTIEKSANRAAELTAQLLAFARGGRYEPKIISLNSVVDETLEIIGRTFDKLIEIDVHLRDSIPTVEADPGQVQQVLINLCLNARDAMPSGGKLNIETDHETLTVEQAQRHAEARPGSYVVLSVTDTGVGMDKETVQRIFEPFFTTKEKGKGTGLGLSMVYGVVKNHGGHVSVSSKRGKGSKFKIYLPASGKSEMRDASKQPAARGGNELILVVDDEEVVRSLAKDALESYGYTVLVARDGVEAVDAYRENNGNIGLVIIDMVMPRMGGRETFLKLKELNPRVKALLSTGYSRNGKVNEILRTGVMGFIQKPFQLEELLSRVRTVLDTKTSA
ncbi:MAG: PAS domain S-box protein [Candidatus Abyssobacteria bacterium SURF_17]|uniref:histidine kinase n=1 Tax=Candidatus Abyssobacteria bacterium SURF_17 TaxID=2093361 RepID=A0A419F568_9BACT|nr:MAG: PAS domain S-box protein [Candidatus Abyssubacteria bacterium SURF_17]